MRLAFVVSVAAAFSAASATVFGSPNIFSFQPHDFDEQTRHVEQAQKLSADPSSVWLHSASRQFSADASAPQTNLSALIRSVNTERLTTEEKLSTIQIIRQLLEDVNPNTRIYTTIHKADPLRHLSRLRRKVISGDLSNWQFHRTMHEIFSSCNDFHFRYIPPLPLRAAAATLGFSVTRYYPHDNVSRDEPRFLVSSVTPGLKARLPPLNSDILAVDGVATLKVVKINGHAGYGANPSARLARGMEALTTRLLTFDDVPTQNFVDVKFRSLNGTVGNIRVPWIYVNISNPLLLSLVLVQPQIPRTTRSVIEKRTRLPQLERRTSRDSSISFLPGFSRNAIEVHDGFSLFIEAYIVQTPRGSFGVLKFGAFASSPIPQLVSELRRLLRLMPPSGLLLDVRGNLGGSPGLVRVLCEMVSNKKLPYMPLTLRATHPVRKILSNGSSLLSTNGNESKILEALRTAILAGEDFTGPGINVLDYDYGLVKNITREYFGPVVSVMDGRTYSAGDVFAALQKDAGISTLIGFDDATGGGGASTATYSILRNVSAQAFPCDVPLGINVTTSFARFYRTGTQAGKLVESFGVEPIIRYFPTKRDALYNEADFFLFVARNLNSTLISKPA